MCLLSIGSTQLFYFFLFAWHRVLLLRTKRMSTDPQVGLLCVFCMYCNNGTHRTRHWLLYTYFSIHTHAHC